MEKKLYKTSYNKMIGGVCNGLSEYFNIDVSLIRLGFVLFALMSGSGLIVYLVLWAILPTKNY